MESDSRLEPLQIIDEYCIGCGICSTVSPDDFEIVKEKAIIKPGYQLSPTVIEAQKRCPTNAILINAKQRKKNNDKKSA